MATTLPANAIYLSLKNTSYSYNANYDITWSFRYMISSTSAQHGLCTYLTTLSAQPSVAPEAGHYLCVKPSDTQTLTTILTGTTSFAYQSFNILSIAFDTTGLFALSATNRPGVLIGAVKPNALIVRDYKGDVIYNESLSATAFNFENVEQIVRCRFSNAEKNLYIDFKTPSSDYTQLALIPLDFRVINTQNLDRIYTGFSFCSPVSTTDTNTARLLLYNFHNEGTSNYTTVEVISSSVLA